MLDNFLNAAQILDFFVKYVIPAIGLVGGGTGLFAYAKFQRAKDNRLFQNTRRPLAVISTESQSMTNEVDLLERTGFFKPIHFGVGGRNLQLLGDIKPRAFVVGYSPSSPTYRRALDYAQNHVPAIPVIVFAQDRITDTQDMKEIMGYSFGALCNTDLRLISDVFSVMSTFPEDK